jgi:plasmid stabilization system protein ParE
LTPVRITRLAQADIEKAAAWYESQREGLGVTFVDRVAETVDSIALNPLGYEKRIKDVRMYIGVPEPAEKPRIQ